MTNQSTFIRSFKGSDDYTKILLEVRTLHCLARHSFSKKYTQSGNCLIKSRDSQYGKICVFGQSPFAQRAQHAQHAEKP